MKCFNWTSAGLLVAAFVMTGCSEPQPSQPAANTPAVPTEGDAEAPHSHGSGPNGGVVFDMGSHHAEFTVDHPKQTVFLLFVGDDEKTPTAVAAEELTLNIDETKTAEGKVVEAMTITLTPEEPVDGKASRFVGTDPGIGNVADFAGTVSGEIDSKPAQGEFKE